MLESFDPKSIVDETLRAAVLLLMNEVERLAAENKALKEEVQRLRDENRRLKGEQGTPTIRPVVRPAALSSERERHSARPHRKRAKQRHVVIDRQEICQVDAQTLPPDAQFKGYVDVVVQDVVFTTDNVLFRKEKFYSPSAQRTYLAPLPAGYDGEFGPGVRAWILSLAYASGVSQPKIKELLETVGLTISAGEISNILIKHQEVFHQERQDILAFLMEDLLVLDQDVGDLPRADRQAHRFQQFFDLRLTHPRSIGQREDPRPHAGAKLAVVARGQGGQIRPLRARRVELLFAEQHVVGSKDNVLDDHIHIALELGIGRQGLRIYLADLLPIDHHVPLLGPLAVRPCTVPFPLRGQCRGADHRSDRWGALLAFQPAVLVPQPLDFFLEGLVLRGQPFDLVHQEEDGRTERLIDNGRGIKALQHGSSVASLPTGRQRRLPQRIERIPMGGS